jgi:RHS repeat-associated protein
MPHAHYEYGPFGEALRVTGPSAALNPFRFSTKRTDPTTDLVLYEYRVYSPTLGRWLSRDRVQEPGGLNLYAVASNDSVSTVDVLGLWNKQVHLFKTLEWSVYGGFGPSYAALIAESDNRVDTKFGTGPYPWGTMDRHLNQPSKTGGQDSRRDWYSRKYGEAVRALEASDRSQNRMHCVKAAEAFGEALHSLQDFSAHRNWPYPGEDWPWHTAHPAWWDDWVGETDAGSHYSDGFWMRYYATHPADEDYNVWTGSLAQRLSQAAARAMVTLDSAQAIGNFAAEVRKHCFCRKEMLLSP